MEFKLDCIVPVHISVIIKAESKAKAEELMKDGAVDYSLYDNWESEDEVQILNVEEVKHV